MAIVLSVLTLLFFVGALVTATLTVRGIWRRCSEGIEACRNLSVIGDWDYVLAEYRRLLSGWLWILGLTTGALIIAMAVLHSAPVTRAASVPLLALIAVLPITSVICLIRVATVKLVAPASPDQDVDH